MIFNPKKMGKINLNKFPVPAVTFGIFFLFIAVYFAVYATQLFFFQEKTSLFIFSADFLHENLRQPGGLLVYFTKFVTTFFYYPIAGAITVSLVITLIALTTSEILIRLTGKKFRVLAFILGTGLFYLQTNYQFMFIYNLGLLLQLSIFLLSISYSTQLKGWIPVALAPLCVFFMGGFVWIYLWMTILTLILQWNKKAVFKVFVLLTVLSSCFFVSMHYIYFQSLKTLLLFPFTTVVEGMKFGLYFTIAGIIALLQLLAKVKIALPEKWRLSEPVMGWITFPCLLVALVLIGITQSDRKTRDYFEVEKLFSQEKYKEVIAFNIVHPSLNKLTIYLNNIALCETGQLNDFLFHFPQMPDGSTLFLKWELEGEVLRRGAYFYYTIGMINEAQRWAFENMVMKGHTPEGLKMLIKTSLINGNFEMAKKYISILKQTLFYREDAIRYESMCLNNKLVEADPDLGEKVKNKLKSDFFTISEDPYVNIERILANDSLNRKAMDYKIALVLLQKNFKGVAEILPKLERCGYTKIPIHLQEAALEYKVLNFGPLPQPGNLAFSPDVEINWGQFITTFKPFNNNIRAAEPTLRGNFRYTFWYYAFYR